MDFIGRAETLREDLQHILGRIGIHLAMIPRVNVSNTPRDYRRFYTDETQCLAEEFYKVDIETFNYTFY